MSVLPSLSESQRTFCVCVCMCSLSISPIVGPSRILELSDTLKHLQSQSSEKDASLNTMQISLDRMVGPWESAVGGGRYTGG